MPSLAVASQYQANSTILSLLFQLRHRMVKIWQQFVLKDIDNAASVISVPQSSGTPDDAGLSGILSPLIAKGNRRHSHP
ncbi:hypothetical protein LA080_000123 [Diaporthe eres]|nr:hypothetical protein LA080_000123 [Diaporthe eres]